MAINLSARNYKLIVDGLDCTNTLVSADGGWSHYDQSGLALIDANFVLKRSIDWTESLDDRVNPRWARGKRLLLDIADSSGVLRPAPVLGYLYILNAEYDGISQLKIEAGCILNLLNFRTPLGDGACFDLGTTTDLNTVAIKLLQKAGITSFVGNIINAPLTVSLPKLSNESYVQLFGKLCWANNYIAYQNNLGSVTVKRVHVNPIPIHIKTVGIDDARYDRLTGSEKPCEKIRVTGVINRTKKTESLTTTVTDEYGPLLLIDPESNNTSLIILSKTITTESLEFQTRKRIVDTKKYEPIGKILPKDFPGRSGLILSEATQENNFYEQEQDYGMIGEDNCNNPDEGKLIKTSTITFRPLGVVLREWIAVNPKSIVFTIASLVIAQSSLTTYEYKIKRKNEPESEITIIPSVASSTYIPYGAILPDEPWVNIPLGLVISQSKTQVWEEIRMEDWKYTEKLFQNLITAFPELFDKPKDDKSDKKNEFSLNSKLILVNKENKVIRSNSGQATPPAPERFPPTHSIKQEQVKVEVNIPASFGSGFRPREREFSVDAGLLTSKSQAEKIGKIEGHILWGRYKGQSIALALGDELFNISPIVGSVWTDLSGSRHLFMVDGFSVALANNRFAAQFDGIWSGTVAGNAAIIPGEPIPKGAVSPPYMLIEDVEIRTGWGFEILDFPYSIEPVFIDIFIGSGTGFNMSPTVFVSSGSGFNVFSFEGIDPGDSYIVDFRLGTGFNVRSFTGIDTESDAISLGSGNSFDTDLVSSVSSASGFSVRSFAGIDTESDAISLGSGNNFGTNSISSELITDNNSFLVDNNGNRFYASIADLGYLNLEPEVVDYKNRIISNNGSIIYADLIAHNLLLKDLKAAGLWSKIKELYTFAGNDLTSALCKFKYISQPNLINVGFGTGNYDKFFGMSGLANGYLRTGIIPNNSFVDGDIHIATQVQMIGSSSSWYASSFISNTSAFGLQRSSFVHRAYTGILSASPTRSADTAGFVGFTRVGTSNLIKVFGRSQLFTTAPSNPSIAASLPSLDMALFARNNNGVFDILSRDVISCFSIGTGFTATELDALESIIKTFQIGIGRV